MAIFKTYTTLDWEVTNTEQVSTGEMHSGLSVLLV